MPKIVNQKAGMKHEVDFVGHNKAHVLKWKIKETNLVLSWTPGFLELAAVLL